MNQYEIRKISYESPLYPKRLRNIPDAPKTLYVIGSLPDDTVPSCAIVGARMCSRYGSTMAREFSRVLASHGIQIISGMAIGIDSIAQRGALEGGGGKTYAVLGCGADICYPSGNQTLYDTLAQNFGILSEVPPGSPPLRYNFPLRNRIISGLSDVVLVVEAKLKSGSLITADYALEQGRTVYAVPGRVGDALSDGCNNLISQGAGIASSPEVLLEEFDKIENTLSFEAGRSRLRIGRERKEKRVLSDSTLTEASKKIYQLLSWSESIGTDEISARTELSIPEVNAALMRLLLSGYIVEDLPGLYMKSM